MPIELAASMPPNTAVPTPLRLISAAPVATTSGTRPRMKANEVIITAPEALFDSHNPAARNGHAGFALLFGEFNDKDAVLGGERDQHDKADLAVKIEVQSRDLDGEIRAEHADRDRKQHRDRYRPALIKPYQEQVGEQNCQPKDDSGLAGCRLLLI